MCQRKWKDPVMKLTLLLLLPFVLFFGCNENSGLREYIPIVYVNDVGLVDNVQLLTENHLNNLEHVLNFYKVKYTRVSAKVLLIDSSVDRDLQWNYTSKANDKVWINSHPN